MLPDALLEHSHGGVGSPISAYCIRLARVAGLDLERPITGVRGGSNPLNAAAPTPLEAPSRHAAA